MSDNGMITVTCSSNEYELWILENKEVVLEFIKENEVWIKDLPIRSRTYGALRMNGFNYLSDIIFMSSADFEELEFMTPTSAKEIASFCREYLRDKKQEIIRYALKDVVDIEETLLAESSEYADSSTEEIDVQENTSVCKIIPSEAVCEELTESFESEVDDKVVDEVIDEKPVTITCDETAERESAAIICNKDIEYESVDEEVESKPVGEICDEASECDQASVDELDIKQILNTPLLKKKVIEYAAHKNTRIESIDFSGRVYRCLKRGKYNFLADLLDYYPDRFSNIKDFGEKAVEEVCGKVEYILTENKSEIIAFIDQGILPEKAENEVSKYDQVSIDDLDIKQILNIPYLKEKVIEYAAIKDVPIESFDLSVRTYNCLKREKLNTLADVLSYYPDRYINIRKMGAKSVEEICGKVEYILTENKSEIIAFIDQGILPEKAENEDYDQQDRMNEDLSSFFYSSLNKLNLAKQCLQNSELKAAFEEYLKEHDIKIEQLNLSVRAYKCLKRANVNLMSEILIYYPDKFLSIRNLGAKAVSEICPIIESYFVAKYEEIIGKNYSIVYSDEFVRQKIVEFYDKNPFVGISFKEFRAAIPAEVDDDRIKGIVGKMLADNELEYVDFRCYRVYPSFYKALEEATVDSDPKYKEILSRKYHGETLEEIGQSLGITRERVRQLLKKAMDKIRAEFKNKSGINYFDEAYYEYLYSNYDLPKEACFEYLNISEDTLNYLKNTYSAGKKKIAEALNDSNVDLTLKMRITDYMNKDKVLLGGILIERNRAALEDYYMSQHCLDEIGFEDFAVQFNCYLTEHNLGSDEKLVYTEDLKRARKKRLAESMKCLWKFGEKLRYYDIAAYDYTELLDAINLDAYENIELSTLKFFEDYPEIMEKYDIRDQYELHNLLKKIIANGEYHDIAFHRQPMIAFGEFDRDEAIYDIMAALSPVTLEDLVEYIHLEYGYDKASIQWNHLECIKNYYHNGFYSTDFKRIEEDRKTMLKDVLTEDFYFISELKKIYSNIFENADMEEINPYTLKELGFLVYSTYAIQNYPTAEAYFRSILTRDDVFSLAPYRKKYGYIQAFSGLLIEMRKNYDLLIYDNDQIISIRRLEKLGITKQDIKDYCDEVYEYADIDAYFTIHSLRDDGFVSKLDDLGFDDSFYAGILSMDPRFRYQQIFGNTVLYKGENLSAISKKSFIISLAEQYDSIAIDELMEECFDQYGIKIPNPYDIKEAIVDTKMYYDPIMGKVYRNKEYYYADIDD